MRFIKLSPLPAAMRDAVPVSVSDPTVQVAVPVKVTSLIMLPPVSAEIDWAANATACWVAAGGFVATTRVGRATMAKHRTKEDDRGILHPPHAKTT